MEREIENIPYSTAELFAARRHALQKLLLFDIQLVFDTYIATLLAQVEAARDETENYAESLEEEIESRTRELADLSRIDSLTGLANRNAFYGDLRRELSNVDRTNETLTLAFCDLNNFKTLNDTEGHGAGDKILQLVADVFRKNFRETDFFCRYAGDEFCVIMPRTNCAEARLIAERALVTLTDRSDDKISLSIGIQEATKLAAYTMDDLVHLADKNMYRAKAMARKDNRNHIVTSADIEAESAPAPSLAVAE